MTTTTASQSQAFRVLVIDDTASIHADFNKVLCGDAQTQQQESSVASLDQIEAQLFGAPAAPAAQERPSTMRFEIDSAMQGQDGVEKLRAAIAEGRPYAMAFVDMRMPPGWDGVQTIRELWKVEPELQVAICTAYSDYTPDQVAAELKLDGRMLILRKPFERAEIRQLAAALCDRWQMARRKAELERIVAMRAEEFRQVALYDGLTGIPNRLLCGDRLKQMITRGKRDAGTSFAVLYIDIDEFKGVNDNFGHDVGDALIRQVAQRITHTLRDVDTVARVTPGNDGKTGGEALAARLGGDEFAVLLEDAGGATGAARVAQRLLESAHEPFNIDGRQLRCSLSIGITTNDIPYTRPEDMLRDADTAMYHAKRSGRGRFVIFDQKMHESALARFTFECDLRYAIDNRQIEVHYQPIVDLNTKQIAGFEALARWNHPMKGPISPAEFIPVAEQTGLILPLGLHVLQTAAAQLAEWQARRPENQGLTMSVNLSRKQLTSPRIVDDIAAVLKASGVQPGTLKIEITESCVMADPRAAVAILKRIQALGVPLHIDDFGTGYSSLSCLQMFPMEGLKVDRGFVKEITERSDQAVLLGAIVTLAHRMKVPLICEGVETNEQAALLTQMGCDFAQGYLFARPMDAGAATTYLAARSAPRAAA